METQSNNHFKHERTLVIIKPDGVQRSLIGEITGRLERVGLKLVAVKMMVATKDQAEQHYTLEEGWLENVGKKTIENYKKKGLKPPVDDPKEQGKRVLAGLTTFMTSGPVVPMVWQGAHAVELVRKLVGSTEPLSSDVGTIRGDYVMDSYEMADGDGRAVRNIIHASGSVEEAENEIAHWFKPEEIVQYNQVQEKILYEDMEDLLE